MKPRNQVLLAVVVFAAIFFSCFAAFYIFIAKAPMLTLVIPPKKFCVNQPIPMHFTWGAKEYSEAFGGCEALKGEVRIYVFDGSNNQYLLSGIQTATQPSDRSNFDFVDYCKNNAFVSTSYRSFTPRKTGDYHIVYEYFNKQLGKSVLDESQVITVSSCEKPSPPPLPPPTQPECVAGETKCYSDAYKQVCVDGFWAKPSYCLYGCSQGKRGEGKCRENKPNLPPDEPKGCHYNDPPCPPNYVCEKTGKIWQCINKQQQPPPPPPSIEKTPVECGCESKEPECETWVKENCPPSPIPLAAEIPLGVVVEPTCDCTFELMQNPECAVWTENYCSFEIKPVTQETGFPVDSPCSKGWDAHEGAKINMNEEVFACDLFEVKNSKLLALVKDAKIYCGKALSDEYHKSLIKAARGNQKHCVALYIIDGLGKRKKFMEGYFYTEIRRGILLEFPIKYANGLPPTPAPRPPTCVSDVGYVVNIMNMQADPRNFGSPRGWVSDDYLSENNCVMSDLPAHVSVFKLHTGTCVDYSVVLTTLLRMAGFTKNEVLTVTGKQEDSGHAYNLVKFPNEEKYTIVDTTGNNPNSLRLKPKKDWWTYCDYSLCVNDGGEQTCPQKNAVYGC